MIAIHNDTTASTDMCSNAERFLDNRATVGALLAGIVRWYSDDGDIMQKAIALDPLEEDSPSCVMDRFGKLAVTNHIADLKVFIANQVVRRDNGFVLLSGKIFT